MTLDAAQIAALLEGTTPGPWAHELLMHSDPNGDEYASDVEVSVGRVHIHGHDLGYDDGPVDEAIKANARLIAAAPDLARTALDAIAAREAAERERDALREALEGLLHYEIAHVGPFAGQRVIAARAALKETPK